MTARWSLALKSSFWLSVLICGFASLALTEVAAATRPNLLFILVDDLDYRTATNPTYMPRVHQRLVTGGTQLTRTYTQYALCSPSRATMLTGRYSQNTGVRRNATPFGGFQTFYANGMHNVSVNVWLKAAGYRTGLIGKFINGYPSTAPSNYVPPNWDYWAVTPGTNSYNYRVNENGVWRSYGSAPTDYSTDVFSHKAQQFITGAADAQQPFLLYLWLPAIHSPVASAPRHAGLFANATIPRVPNFNEADISDKPPFLRPGSIAASTITALDANYRERLRSLQAVDEAVEAIYQLLEAKGLLSNTYIALAGDNGFHMGEHRFRQTKGFAYEESVHIPLFVRGPGVPAGRQIGRLIGNADFAPTFASWAGVTPPASVDGRSFAGLLTAANPAAMAWRKALPLSKLPEAKTPATSWSNILNPAQTTGYRCIATTGTSIPEMRGVRTERFTYTHYTTGDMELYDGVSDPYQLANRICSAPASQRDTLRIRAAELSTCKGATCRLIEDRWAP